VAVACPEIGGVRYPRHVYESRRDRFAKAGQKTVGVILLNPSIDVLAKRVVASCSTSTYSTQKKRIKVFIDETRQGRIAVARWGWCQETDAKGDSVHPHLPIAFLGLDAVGIHRRSRLTTLSVSIIEGVRGAPLPDIGLMSCCTAASPRVLLCNGLRSRLHGC
jgi:hypothetical protein